MTGATVSLPQEDGTAVRSVLTDSAGAFTPEAPHPGVYRLRASRLGYRTGTSAAIDRKRLRRFRFRAGAPSG
ncbi:MAG TPA: carboxypeptidase-like regulatory domain-containing protein [Longimicrobium sp.]|nr:carboxypeptidase-like regulatory domain-containing protein [Longimicrobium sp.]